LLFIEKHLSYGCRVSGDTSHVTRHSSHDTGFIAG